MLDCEPLNNGAVMLVHLKKQWPVLSREMSFLEHIDELRSRLLRIIVTVITITLFAFLFGVRTVQLEGRLIPLPFPDPFQNIASLVIKRIEADMLPQRVRLIVTSPGQAILAQLHVSMFLGVIVAIPVIVHQIAAFLAPGLYHHERRSIQRLLLPSGILFVVGAAFTYLWVVPTAIEFLYAYASALDAETFINVNELIQFVLLFALAGGISFQLPVVMWIVTKAGIVDSGFWRRNLSYAIVAIVIFGAAITPDGSGITMWLISGPMIALYIAAYLLIRRVKE